jgi:hypothetical protein
MDRSPDFFFILPFRFRYGSSFGNGRQVFGIAWKAPGPPGVPVLFTLIF